MSLPATNATGSDAVRGTGSIAHRSRTRRDPADIHARRRAHLTRAYKTTRNTDTAWWDASQLYGYDDRSRRRVHRDPGDPARLLDDRRSLRVERDGDRRGYLPPFAAGDPINPQWAGQEATAFPDNWTIGLSFFHNVFAREHNRSSTRFGATPRAHPMPTPGCATRRAPTRSSVIGT